MECACGHHHPKLPLDPSAEMRGVPVPLDTPLIALSGQLVCADVTQMMIALSLLPDHAAATRAEPGCLRFDVWQDEDPHVWHLAELFCDAAAFAAHQERGANSPWGRDSTGIGRSIERRSVLPHLRQASPGDMALAAIHQPAGTRSTILIEAEGTRLGHVALSPLHDKQGTEVALSLGPVTVNPAMRDRGLYDALIHAALTSAQGKPVVAENDPMLAGFGFREAASLPKGPALLVHGDPGVIRTVSWPATGAPVAAASI